MAVQQICQESSPIAVVGRPAGLQVPKPAVAEVLQILCEQSISAAGRKAVGLAIASVPGALQRLMTLMQVRQAARPCKCCQWICAPDTSTAYNRTCSQTVPADLKVAKLEKQPMAVTVAWDATVQEAKWAMTLISVRHSLLMLAGHFSIIVAGSTCKHYSIQHTPAAKACTASCHDLCCKLLSCSSSAATDHNVLDV